MTATAMRPGRDFFERGEGRRAGAAAPAGGDVHRDDPSS
jgi:hypothetical protein